MVWLRWVRGREEWRRGLVQVAALGLCLGLAAPAAAAPREFHFEELNGVYPDLSFQAPPVAWGPFQVRLQSPRFTVLLHRNRLQASPLGNGRHRIAAEAEASGHGHLIADVAVAGLATRREDSAVAPRQTLALEGVATGERFWLARKDLGEAYAGELDRYLEGAEPH